MSRPPRTPPASAAAPPPSSDALAVAPAELSDPGVRALLERHLEAMRAGSPPGQSYALGPEALLAGGARLYAARLGAAVVGVAALRVLGEGVGELKSMRTDPDRLRRGVARALLQRILADARDLGLVRLSLETGSGPAFEPALALYRSVGFVPGPAFGGYPATAFNRFLHLELAPAERGGP